jgi:hypothetical protein
MFYEYISLGWGIMVNLAKVDVKKLISRVINGKTGNI